MATLPASARLSLQNIRTAKIEATTEGGANTLIAAVTNSSIVVVGYVLTVTKAGIYTFKDSTETQAKLSVGENGGASYVGAVPAFSCVEGKALELETAASAKAYGHIAYVLV